MHDALVCLAIEQNIGKGKFL